MFDDPTGTRRLLLTTKINLAAPPPALAYRLVSAPNGASLIQWEGLSPHTAETALARAPRDAARRDAARRDALDEATSILSDGPLPAEEVRRQASQAGLGPSLLWRAKLALGVRSHKIGVPGQRDQSGVWVPPSDPAPTPEDSIARSPESS